MCNNTHGPVAIYIPHILNLHIQHVTTDRVYGQYQNMKDWRYVKQAVINSSKRVVCMHRGYQTFAMKCSMLWILTWSFRLGCIVWGSMQEFVKTVTNFQGPYKLGISSPVE